TVAELTIKQFKLRCWARATLYELGELTLHDAVDLLQHIAVDGGLVTEIGQDVVQQLMAQAFDEAGPKYGDECDLELELDDDAAGWREAARQYHANRGQRCAIVEINADRLARLRRLLDPDVSLDRTYNELAKLRELPKSTSDAAEYLVRL